MEAISVAIFRATFEIGLLVVDERKVVKSIKKRIAQDGGNEAIIELHSKVWKPGKMQMINVKEFEEQPEEMKEQLHYKVWDLGNSILKKWI